MQYILPILLLAAGVAEGRPELMPRACALSSCFRTAFAARPSVASSDCSSFFHATVSPCPTTTTFVRTQTATAAVHTVVSTIRTTTYTSGTLTTVVATSPHTDLATTSVPAAPTTITQTDPSGNTQTTTVSAVTTTITVTASTTTTTVVAISTEAQKRDLDERAAACTARTISATSIPTYAAACGAVFGNLLYASECYCYGARWTTTTLARATVSTTRTFTVTSTPTSTVRSSVTINGGTTEIQTQRTTVVTETTITQTTTYTPTITSTVMSDATSTVTPVSSTLTSVTAVATSTYSTTACPLQCVAGAYAGQWVYVMDGSDNYELGFTTDPTQAIDFYIDNQGRLFDNGIPVLVSSSPPSYVQNEGTAQYDGMYTVYTACTTDANNYLYCTDADSSPSSNLWLVKSNNGWLYMGDSGDEPGYGYTSVTLGFIC